MEYLTKNSLKLKIPEYGRNIQQMVNHMLGIRDKDTRTAAAFRIIEVMKNVTRPSSKDQSEYETKLWNDLLIMTDYSLDIHDLPISVFPKRETTETKKRIPYPKTGVKHSHYGELVAKFIRKIVEMKNKDEREALAILTANYMKRTLISRYKKDVNDSIIFDDLKKLSAGKIEVNPNTTLCDFKFLLHSHKRQKSKKNTRRGYY